MGFIKAFSGALRGSFADQWKDFISVPSGLTATTSFGGGWECNTDSFRTSNYNGVAGVITNGSTIVIPEGFALITLENGAITGYVDEPGGYTWNSSSEQSESIFAGGTFMESVIRASFERFKFGGEPGAIQMPLFVNLKEIPDFKFGTQSRIYWDDAYLGTQAGATARGACTLRIIDPIMFLKEFVPADYYALKLTSFDLMDYENKASEQLFSELVASLAPAFSSYANRNGRASRILDLQRDSREFAASLREVVERNYHWRQQRGIEIVRGALASVDYDEQTKKLLEKVQQADALMGARGNTNFQASFAEGLQAAGVNQDAGALGMAFMGMGAQGVAGSYASFQQPVPSAQPPQEDPYEKLKKLKGLLDSGVITQADFDAAKAKLLGI